MDQENKITLKVNLTDESCHEIDAKAYAEIILGICLIIETSFEVYKLESPPRLLVTGNNRQGSVEWDILIPLINSLTDISIIHNSLQSALKVITLQFSKIKGRRHKFNSERTQLVVLGEDDRIVVPQETIEPKVAEILDQNKTKIGLDSILSIGDNNDINNIDITININGEKDRQPPILREDIAETANFIKQANMPQDTEDLTSEEEVILAEIRTVNFETKKWVFKYENKNFTGQISDDEFWDDVQSSKILFYKGQKVSVTRQFIKPKQYRILKIDKAPNLFDEA